MADRMREATGRASGRTVAEATGFNHETVRRYLAGRGITAEFIAVFCKTYGISADWLLFGDDSKRTGARLTARQRRELAAAEAGIRCAEDALRKARKALRAANAQ